MEDFQVVYPPNKPMERRFVPAEPHSQPRQAIFVDCNETGHLIVGSSDFLLSEWTGTLFLYNNFEEYQDNVGCKRYMETTTVCDGKFLDNENILLANDAGRLSVIKLADLVDDGNFISKDTFWSATRIEQLDRWKSNKNVLSCSENYITLWETNGGLSPLFIYRNYHTDLISSVCCKPDIDKFLSGSWDKRVCLWDIRSDTPATVINDMLMGPVTAVALNPEDDNYVITGTTDGYVCTIDCRKPKEFVDKNKIGNFKVHSLSTHSTRASVGVCSDSNIVQVLDCKNGDLKITFECSIHKDMVRGLTWNKDDLLSCGLDGKVHKHICA